MISAVNPLQLSNGNDASYDKVLRMKRTGLFFLCLTLFLGSMSFAQHTTETHEIQAPRIAVFAPLYLDSVVDAAGNYKLGKYVPRYIQNGLDFYEGLALALDSLNNEGLHLQVQVYDTRGKTSIFKLADSGALDSVNLIIGSVSGSEFLDLATVAKEKQIPFVSASYPNDGGIRGNPYVIIVNSKLNTHLQALYNYILRNHALDKITMFRRKNAADDRVTKQFHSFNSSSAGPVLNIREVTLNQGFTPENIVAALDKEKQNLIVCGSLDDNFGKLLLSRLASLAATYKITVVGMPTWEGYRELATPELRALPIIYSAAFFDPGQTDSWVAGFSQSYARATYSYPSEAAFRGFELMYLFAHLLDQYPGSRLQDNLTGTNFRVLTGFDFKPVQWSQNAATPDYYENKHIYILKQLQGTLLKVN